MTTTIHGQSIRYAFISKIADLCVRTTWELYERYLKMHFIIEIKYLSERRMQYAQINNDIIIYKVRLCLCVRNVRFVTICVSSWARIERI